jgi:hypothetical protein
MPLAGSALDVIWSRLCLTAEYSDQASVDRLIAEDVAFAREMLAATSRAAL